MRPRACSSKFQPHPRAYGTLSRASSAIMCATAKVTSLADAGATSGLAAGAQSETARSRRTEGRLLRRYVVVFDPAAIDDHATFDQPQQYATGMRDVFVNGVQVLKNGEHTGARRRGRSCAAPAASPNDARRRIARNGMRMS